MSIGNSIRHNYWKNNMFSTITIAQLNLYDRDKILKKPYNLMDGLGNYRTLKITICLIPREIVLRMAILKPRLQEPVALSKDI